jgi:hypothetical protein
MKLGRSQDKENVERKVMSPVNLHGVVLGSGRHTALPAVYSRESLAEYQADGAPLTMSWKMREISRAFNRTGIRYHMAPNLSHVLS